MARAAICLVVLLLSAPLRAEPIAGVQPLDQRLIADVTSAAIAFMLPRTLEEVSADELGLWGLRGLTTLDPRMEVVRNASVLHLTLDRHVVFSTLAPRDPVAWGEIISNVTRAAWEISDPLRRAGTQIIIRSFFNDLFTHLDPYSRYAGPAEAASDAARRNGSAGIGVELTLGAAGFVINDVTPAGPADLAGIRPGEGLSAIDGQPLGGANLAAARALLAGPKDTPVRLTLFGPNHKPRQVRLIRDLITAPTVFAQRAGDLLVIRITAFAHDTALALATELRRPSSAWMRGLVLDLRGNRGGLLRQAAAAAETLVPTGPLANTQGRDPDASQRFEANGADLARGLPVIVLVDGRSASAAEVLAAALADRHRAVVVGSATLGKGLVQTIYPLPDQGALSLTWSRVLAPDGWPIQALGVLPQVCTSAGDEALARQLASLADGRQPLAALLARHHTIRAPADPDDLLRIRNTCPASEGRDADMQTARFLAHNQAAYTAALLP